MENIIENFVSRYMKRKRKKTAQLDEPRKREATNSKTTDFFFLIGNFETTELVKAQT